MCLAVLCLPVVAQDVEFLLPAKPPVAGGGRCPGGVSAAAGFTATVAFCIGGLQIMLTRSFASNDFFGPSEL